MKLVNKIGSFRLSLQSIVSWTILAQKLDLKLKTRVQEINPTKMSRKGSIDVLVTETGMHAVSERLADLVMLRQVKRFQNENPQGQRLRLRKQLKLHLIRRNHPTAKILTKVINTSGPIKACNSECPTGGNRYMKGLGHGRGWKVTLSHTAGTLNRGQWSSSNFISVTVGTMRDARKLRTLAWLRRLEIENGASVNRIRRFAI